MQNNQILLRKSPFKLLVCVSSRVSWFEHCSTMQVALYTVKRSVLERSAFVSHSKKYELPWDGLKNCNQNDIKKQVKRLPKCFKSTGFR